MGSAAVVDEVIVDCSLPLQTRDPDELEATYRCLWSSAISASEASTRPQPKVVFDLDRCPALDPGAILLLMAVASRLRAKGRQPWIRGSSPTRQKLSEHLNYYLTPKHQRKALPRRPGTYPLRDISDRRHASAELAEWSQTVRQDTQATEEQVARWEFQISEAITNAFQHGVRDLVGAMEASLVAGESFSAGGREQVQLAAMDFGSTIPYVVAKAVGAPSAATDGKLIKFATKDGVTSKSHPSNQGRGLADVVSAATSCNGSMQILSRNGLAYVMPGEARVRWKTLKLGTLPNPILKGTLVVVNLRIS